MEFVYMLVCNGAEWEDLILFVTKEEAIEASIKYPKRRVEVFKKDIFGFTPTYTFYVNGNLSSS